MLKIAVVTRQAFALLLVLGLLTFDAVVFAQNVISGLVRDESGKGIIQVTLILKHQNKPLKFTYSDAQGRYEFKDLPQGLDLSNSLIETHHLSYESLSIPLKSGVWVYPIQLVTKENRLDVVEIGRRPISGGADTLRFDVAFFTQVGDKSIGDVLKNMPGIEVAESGKISYMGQEISDFYIDGDDLFAGRYGLGTKVISHDMINFVEVIRNHQRIRALESRVPSNDVAINLLVKDDRKMDLSGEAYVSGALPLSGDAEISTILFGTRLKTLQVLSANNSGKNLASSNENLTGNFSLEGGFKGFLRSSNKTLIPSNYDEFYANQAALLSSNVHFNLSKNWKMRVNLGGYLDELKHEQREKSEVYTLDEIIRFTEDASSILKPLDLHLETHISKNIEQFYFSNTLKGEFKQRKSFSDLMTNGIHMNNLVKQHFWNFNNAIEFIPSTSSKHIWNYKLNVGTQRTPEKLALSTYDLSYLGQGILNDLTATGQNLLYANQYAVGSIRFILNNYSWLKQNYNFESAWNQKQIESKIDLLPEYTSNFDQNDLNWQEVSQKLTGNYEFTFSKLNVRANLTGQYLQQDWIDQNFSNQERLNRFYFLPSLRAKYSLGMRSQLSMNYLKTQKVGEIWNVFRGEIIQDYRTIIRSNSQIPEISQEYIQAEYLVENPGKMLFGKLTYNYIKGISNVISKENISEENIEIEAVDFKNNSYAHNYGVSIDHLINIWKLKWNISVEWMDRKSLRLIRDNVYKNVTHAFTLTPQFNVQAIEKLQIYYSGQWMWSKEKTEQISLPTDQYFISENRLNFRYALNQAWQISSQADYLYMQFENYNFDRWDIGATLQFKPLKSPLTYEIIAKNITNVQALNYKIIQSQSILEKHERIRGQVYQLKLGWRF